MSKVIVAPVDYVQGHLRTGEYVLTLTDEEFAEFEGLSKEEQYEWIRDAGNFLVTDTEIDSIGDITSFKVSQ